MSHKNMDKKNRWRNETIAFHVSHEEKKTIEKNVKLCGYRTKQEFILDSLIFREVKAVGNPLMLVTFRKELRKILVRLEDISNVAEMREVNEEAMLSIKMMLEILEAFAERGDV